MKPLAEFFDELDHVYGLGWTASEAFPQALGTDAYPDSLRVFYTLEVLADRDGV